MAVSITLRSINQMTGFAALHIGVLYGPLVYGAYQKNVNKDLARAPFIVSLDKSLDVKSAVSQSIDIGRGLDGGTFFLS